MKFDSHLLLMISLGFALLQQGAGVTSSGAGEIDADTSAEAATGNVAFKDLNLGSMITLHDYNAAFNLAAYCIDQDDYLVPLNRHLCGSSEFTWRRRPGFETEEAWQAAVREEMAYLSKGNTGGSSGKVGIWQAEAPPAMILSGIIIKELESSLELSLDKLVISEDGRRFLTVCGALEDVMPMLKAGFTSLTPVPRRLKISPQVFEPVRREQAEEHAGNGEEESREYGLEVQLATVSEKSTAPSTNPQALSATWHGLLTTTLQHTNVIVEVVDQSKVLVEGVTRAEALRAAIVLADLGVTELITPTERIEMSGDTASGFLQSGQLDNYPLWDIGIHGEGQIVGVRDGGFDIKSCYYHDPDQPTVVLNDQELTNLPNHRKLVQVFDMNGNSHHGTAVAGCVAGYPEGMRNPEHGTKYKGVAYKAKLVLHAFGTIPDGPSGFANTLEPAYEAGARIHTNSYGSAPLTKYGWQARDIDQFMYTNQDFLVLFAAGNSGSNGASSSVMQCQFKSGICVGASGNDANNREKLTYFSGRGPSSDGRIKPDLVAPGIYIGTSKKTTDEDRCAVAKMVSGTSVASPLLAGTAALVRQYFMDGYYPKGEQPTGKGFIPMAALIKAVLVNSGIQLTGDQATLQGTNFPNMDQGFGLAQADNVLVTPASPVGLVTRVQGEWSPDCGACPKVGHGVAAIQEIKISPSANGLPLRVTLAWSDYWSQPSANKVLINDLDLSLKLNGINYYPNGNMNGPDHLNTVERIIIDEPQPGATYTLTVTGFNVPKGPQPFALVITGPLLDDVADNSRASVVVGGEEGWLLDNYSTVMVGVGVVSCLVGVVMVAPTLFRRIHNNKKGYYSETHE